MALYLNARRQTMGNILACGAIVLVIFGAFIIFCLIMTKMDAPYTCNSFWQGFARAGLLFLLVSVVLIALLAAEM